MTVAVIRDATWIIEVIINHWTAGGLDRVLPTVMTASTYTRRNLALAEPAKAEVRIFS